MMRFASTNKGFSLVETIVASVILSATVLVVVATSSAALRTTRLNRQYETAASIIEKQLSLIDFIGIDGFIELGRMSGEVEEFEPGYHWEITTTAQDIDNLYLVTITVSWLDRGRARMLRVDTMLDGESTTLELESGLESGSQIGGGTEAGSAGG